MEIYNKRFYQILNLFLNSRKILKSESIAISIGVSSRTVRKDIKDINYIIKNKGAIIRSETGIGYTLIINDEKKFSKFINSLKKNKSMFKTSYNIVPSDSEDRVNYIISKLLINFLGKSEIIDQFDLADELFISLSTLKKDIRIVDKKLNKFQLKVSVSQKNGVSIIGDEEKIRFCISEFIFNRNNLTNIEESDFYKKIFLEKEMNIIRDIILEIMYKNRIRLTDIAFKNLVVHTMIMLKRFEKKKKVDYDKTFINLLKNSNEFKSAEEIVNKIREILKVDLGDEVYYLTQHLITSKKFLSDKLSDNEDIKKVIYKMLDRIKEETNVDLFDDIQMINALSVHLSVALNRLRFEMNIRNEFLDLIKNSYPLAFELAIIANDVFENVYKVKSNENEVGFLAIHFGAALERKGLNNKKKIKNAIIICPSGMATGMLIKEKVKKHFNDRINVLKTCPLYELDQKTLDECDLVLTSVEINKFKSKKIIKVNLILDDNDINCVESFLNNGNEFEEIINYKEIFKEELFITNCKKDSRKRVLNYITDLMIEKKYITEKVKKSIYKREEMATTELGNLVAIPHAILNDMDEPSVAVITLQRPILWEKEKVQVVLLLNIPKHKYKIWSKVFKRLYSYLIVNFGVNKLIKGCSYEEFIYDLKNLE